MGRLFLKRCIYDGGLLEMRRALFSRRKSSKMDRAKCSENRVNCSEIMRFVELDRT